MIFCVDCDNVINNLQETVVEIFNRRYGTEYTLEDFQDYDIEQCLSKEEALDMKALYCEKGIYNFVKPISGASTALKKLIQNGHEVYIVTDSHPSIFEEKVNWIKYHFSFIDDSHIVAMKNKWLFKCDVMVEDNLTNLLGKPYYYRICFDYPWNRNTMDDVYGIYRCNNWNDIITAANKIYNEECGIS